MAALQEVCDEQAFILGARVADLEKDIQKYVGVSQAVGVASGTDAILLALMACGVGAGDEVVTVPYTFFATAGSISRLGAKPVFVDIKPDTYNMDPALLEGAVTARTKALLPVHLFGQCAEMEPILQIAARKKVPVIEDAAQAIGAAWRNRAAGSLGQAGCFSFFPSKNLGGVGDGGMVTTNDQALADRVRMLRVHGSRVKYVHEAIGINSRLDALQAAVLRVKLKYLEEWTKGRQRNAARYEALFKQANLLGRVTLPTVTAENHHVYNQYVIRVQRREPVPALLHEAGGRSQIQQPSPLALQAWYYSPTSRAWSVPNPPAAAGGTLAP